ncbi:MAG: VOC family protein, partial [Pseudomonadota bacterium]
MKNVIDHVAIGAANLEQGIAALQKQFGVEVPKGGKHEAMSTHNCVTKVGDGHFLEIIAIDPDAPDPGRTRWFTLDDPGTQARVSERPCPLCWVVGTDDLD